MTNSTVRPIYTIADEIRADWGSKLSRHAEPYLNAMDSLDSIDDHYYLDDARGIVRYFLANAQGWRGETARRIKTELKGML